MSASDKRRRRDGIKSPRHASFLYNRTLLVQRGSSFGAWSACSPTNETLPNDETNHSHAATRAESASCASHASRAFTNASSNARLASRTAGDAIPLAGDATASARASPAAHPSPSTRTRARARRPAHHDDVTPCAIVPTPSSHRARASAMNPRQAPLDGDHAPPPPPPPAPLSRASASTSASRRARLHHRRPRPRARTRRPVARASLSTRAPFGGGLIDFARASNPWARARPRSLRRPRDGRRSRARDARPRAGTARRRRRRPARARGRELERRCNANANARRADARGRAAGAAGASASARGPPPRHWTREGAADEDALLERARRLS